MNISISTIQAAAPLTGATLLLVSNSPCKVFSIEGNVNSTTGTNYYIQLLGTATPVSGTTIPLYSRQCVLAATASGVNGFSFVYMPEGLDTARMNTPGGTGSTTTFGDNTLPVYAAISSTDGVWTSVAANTDVTITIEQEYVAPTNTTQVTASGVNTMTVWTDPGVNHKLFALTTVTATASPLTYLMFFGFSPTTGVSTPLYQYTLPPTPSASSTLNQFFGSEGLGMQQGDTSYVPHTGLYIAISSTPDTYVSTVFTNWTFTAYIQ